MKKVPVSFLVPIKNEAANLHRCLSSISWADEIFVVDSHSVDNSAAIAQQHGAQVIQFDFIPPWPKKKNWSLENLPFRNDWVFILDADEVLPPNADAEISAIVSNPNNETNGYWINRRLMFMSRWLKHAYYPNWNLRLVRHQHARYEKLTAADTASGDNEVHEHLIVQGKTARLKTELDHFAFPTIETFVEKHNRYSNWEAHVALEQILPHTAATLQHTNVTWKRRLKTLSHRLPFRPLQRFLYIYILQRGFLDGREGYYFARLHAYYEFLCVAKTHELKNSKKTP